MDCIAGLLEELVSDAGLPETPSQDGGIDGVLCRRAFGELIQQAPRIALSTMVEQHLDPLGPKRNSRKRSSAGDVPPR